MFLFSIWWHFIIFRCVSLSITVLLFQQYVMLHDMVAAHSVVRVSVCRGNKGTFYSVKIMHCCILTLLFAKIFKPLLFHLLFVPPLIIHDRYRTGNVNGARPRWRHRYSSEWDGNALRCHPLPGNLCCEWEHADGWVCSLLSAVQELRPRPSKISQCLFFLVFCLVFQHSQSALITYECLVRLLHLINWCIGLGFKFRVIF